MGAHSRPSPVRSILASVGPRRVGRVAASAVVAALAGYLIMRVPHLAGSTWRDVTQRIGQISTESALAIVALWVAGLGVYTVAMTASMPGLSHRRALVLNLSGSSISNVLPFGGVLGTGLNLAMARSWRLSLKSFASSTAVLNVINLLAKLALPIIAGIVVSRHQQVAPWLGRSAYLASAAAGLVVLAVIAALFSTGWARLLDRMLGRLATLPRIGRLKPRSSGPDAAAARIDRPGPGPVTAMQDQVREVLRSQWRGLTTGITGYVLLQWALFALCLHAAGLSATPGVVFAAFAVERALTLAVVTPAGTGIAEAGATALLVALGESAPAAATGVLLYRLFVYIAEIPVGAIVLAGWAVRTMPRSRTSSPPTPSSR
jgi:uncharacterized membrane protein YbhN (UPF0104 family)